MDDWKSEGFAIDRGENDLEEIGRGFRDYTLTGLLEAYSEQEDAHHLLKKPKPKRNAKNEITNQNAIDKFRSEILFNADTRKVLTFLILKRLDIAPLTQAYYFVDTVNDLRHVVQEQKAEIADIRNTLKKHQHPTLGGLYTGRAEWV